MCRPLQAPQAPAWALEMAGPRGIAAPALAQLLPADNHTGIEPTPQVHQQHLAQSPAALESVLRELDAMS